MTRLIGINLAILLGFVIVLELAFGTWFSGGHALYRFTQVRDTVMTRDNPLPGPPDRIVYTRDAYGFRGLQGSVSEIDLLTVGGSTTDQRWIDDGATFQAVLADLFRKTGRSLSVVNAGIDGQSTFGHIENFASWFDQVPDLHADYILYYVGINDMLKMDAVATFDRVSGSSPLAGLKGAIRAHSALYQVYRVGKGLFAAQPIRHELSRENIADRPPFAETGLIGDPATPVLQTALGGLRRRIATLAELTEAFGARAIFVTQRSARWRREDGKVYGIATYRPDFFETTRASLPGTYAQMNGVDFYNIERAVADVIMDECRRQGATCLDLMADVDFDLATDFYDPLHTTPTGARRIAEYLHDRLSATVFRD